MEYGNGGVRSNIHSDSILFNGHYRQVVEKLKNTKIFICDDCTVVFQVYGMNRKKKYHCPNCGDSIAVRPYVADRSSKSITKIKWRQEELDLLDKCIQGKIQPYQAAILLGRSAYSVIKKISRLKKEAEK